MQDNLNEESKIKQEELLKNIDVALQGEIPKDIMSNKILDEILYYISPIISLLGFALIIVFGIIPNFNDLMGKVQKVDELKIQENTLDQRISKLEVIRLNISELDEIIKKINVIVPEGKTEIVKFSQRIRDNIDLDMEKYNEITSEPPIILDSIKTGELALTTLALQLPGLTINQVPTEFTLTGGFGRFRQFFSNLYAGNDFFVVEKMQLSYDEVNKIWSGDISLVKYQFNKDKNFIPKNIYGSVTEDTKKNTQVIEFLKTKFVDNVLNP